MSTVWYRRAYAVGCRSENRSLGARARPRVLSIALGCILGPAAGCSDGSGGSSSTTSEGTDCQIGTLGCACTSGMLCEYGLECVGMVCIDPNATGDGSTTDGSTDGTSGAGSGGGSTGSTATSGSGSQSGGSSTSATTDTSSGTTTTGTSGSTSTGTGDTTSTDTSSGTNTSSSGDTTSTSASTTSSTSGGATGSSGSAGCGMGTTGLTVQERIDMASPGAVLDITAAVDENVTIAGTTITLRGDCDGSLTTWTCPDQETRAIIVGADTDVTLEGFLFEDCDGGTSSSFNSGVVFINGAADAVRIRNSVFRNNSSHRGPVISNYGGGAMKTDGLVLLENNIMHHNDGDDGGVIYIGGETNITIFNNLIYSNSAVDYCGAIWLRDQVRSKLDFTKNVVWGNTAGRNPALEVYAGEGPIINSSIVTSNTPSDKAAAWGETYSMIGGDPSFTNPGAGDFSLQGGSPAIDAGDPGLPQDSDNSRTDQGVYLDRLPTE